MTNHKNFIIDTCKKMGVKCEDGKWKITPQQMFEIQKAYALEVASIFNKDGNVYIPGHMIQSMILEHFQTLID